MNESMFDAFFLNPKSGYYDPTYAKQREAILKRGKEGKHENA